MVAVELPDANCGHVTLLRQHCGRCLRWCCPACYSPWMALSCTGCRRAAAVAPVPSMDLVDLRPEPPGPSARPGRETDGCRSGPSRRRARTEVRLLTQRVADLERQLEDMRSRP